MDDRRSLEDRIIEIINQGLAHGDITWTAKDICKMLAESYIVTERPVYMEEAPAETVSPVPRGLQSLFEGMRGWAGVMGGNSEEEQ